MLATGDDKRLSKFLQPEKSAKKRLTYAVEYVRNTSQFNESKFINDHSDTLLSLITETIGNFEEEADAPSEQRKLFGVLSSGMKKAFASKITDDKYLMIIELMDRIVFHIPHRLAQRLSHVLFTTQLTLPPRTFLESVYDTLLVFLHPNNALTYRLAGFEVLLRCIHEMELVQPSPQLNSLLSNSIPFQVKPSETTLGQMVNRAASAQNSMQWPTPKPTLAVSEKDFSALSTEQTIVLFLETIFNASVHGLCKYKGYITTRGQFENPLDKINNFIFWRNYIFLHVSSWTLGSRVVDGAPELVAVAASTSSSDSSRSSQSISPPLSKTLRFSTVPVPIQVATENWMVECLSSRILIDHFWASESCYFVLMWLEQRFHPEVLRHINGIEIARRSLQLYKALLGASDHQGPPWTTASSSSARTAVATTSASGVCSIGLLAQKADISGGSSGAPVIGLKCSDTSNATTNIDCAPMALNLAKRPVHFSLNMDMYLTRFLKHVHVCFARLDEGDITAALQLAQICLVRESVELMKYAVSTCPTLAMAATLREKVYDICQNYSTRSRGNKAGTIKTTLRVVAEIGLISVLAAPDWRSKELHCEFSLHLRHWLAERSVVRVEDCNFKNGGIYKYYAKPGDSDAQPPSEFKVILTELWGNLLLTAFNACWLYLDFFRDIDLATQPGYMTYPITCPQILELTRKMSEEVQAGEGAESIPAQNTSENASLPLPPAHSQAGATTGNLWSSHANKYIVMLSIGCMQDAVLAIDRLLGLFPLSTLAVLCPQLHAIVIGSVSDVLLFALKHAIVKEGHFKPSPPLPTEKTERTKQKMAAKARAKLNEHERGSPVSAVNPSTLLGILLPHLITAGMDVRVLFENSKILAMEALCVALQSRSLVEMHRGLQERCLMMLYQALLYSDHVKLLATCVISCPTLFALGIPGASMLLDPMATVIEKLFRCVNWKDNESSQGSIVQVSQAYYSGKYTSPCLQEILERNDDSKLPCEVVNGCLEMLYGICAIIHRFPHTTGVSGVPSRSSGVDPQMTFRSHTMESALRLSVESSEFRCLLPRIVDLIDRYVWITPKYELKDKFLHFLLSLYLLLTHPYDPSSDEDYGSISVNGGAQKSIKRRIAECLCSYIAGTDKRFILPVLESLTNVPDLISSNDAKQFGKILLETTASMTRNHAIIIIQSAVENLQLPVASSPSAEVHDVTGPVTDDKMGNESLDRTRLSSADVLSRTSDSLGRNDSSVDLVKAGIKCMTRWAMRHPTLLEHPDTKEMFLECFDSCSVGNFVDQLEIMKNIRPLLSKQAAGSSSAHLEDITSFINVDDQAYQSVMGGCIPNHELPKLLRDNFGAFSLRDLVTVALHGNDREIRVIGKEADMAMTHLLNFYNRFPCSTEGPAVIDSVLATDNYGLSRAELDDIMGVKTRETADAGVLNSDGGVAPGEIGVHGVSKKQRALLTKSDEVKSDEEKSMVAIDTIEKQNPIHIAFKDQIIFTLVDSVDGVARIICRDMLGAHVWAAVSLDQLPPNPSKEAIRLAREKKKQRARFVKNLLDTDVALSAETRFFEVNPLRMTRTQSAPDYNGLTTSTPTSSGNTSQNVKPSPVRTSHSNLAGSNNPLNIRTNLSRRGSSMQTGINSKDIESIAIETESLALDDSSLAHLQQTSLSKSVSMSAITDERKGLTEERGGDLHEAHAKRSEDKAFPAVDLGRDLFGDLLKELPLHEIEDSTMLKNSSGVKCGAGSNDFENADSTMMRLSSEGTDSFADLHLWVYRMLEDGFLWRRFIEFLKLEYSEEGACFMEDVFKLHTCIREHRQRLEISSETEGINESDLLDKLDQVANTIFTKYFQKGGDHEINISDKSRKSTADMFQSTRSRDLSNCSADEGKPTRELAFYDTVFKNAFDDVSSMLVKDKLTRFFKSIENRISILNELEELDRQVKKSAEITENLLSSAPPIPQCFPPDMAEAVTLKDSVRFFITQLGLLPSPLCQMTKAEMDAAGTVEPIRSYSTNDDFKILCGSNTPYSIRSNGPGNPVEGGSTTRSAGSVVAPKTSKHILQELRHIDELPVREQFKIAVLYVAPGQFRQGDILANTSGSEMYNKFLASLGTDIDLATHRGFNGRLDSNRFSNGRYFPYFADDHVEVFYHVATRMPTIADDEQQINKKRHIGNDFVHIVWTEDRRNYSPLTITSDFGDVVICIHPLPSGSSLAGYCQVILFVKAGLQHRIGPLKSGMIIPFDILGDMVRLTAIQANRAVNTENRKSYDPPNVVRQNAISSVIESCGIPFSYDTLLNLLYASDSTKGVRK